MTSPALQEDQLLELLLQLKKTTPDQARTILNSQPQIAYALMAVMVNVNAISFDVTQKTLAPLGTGASAGPSTVSTSASQPAAPLPKANAVPIALPAPVQPVAPAIPQHIANQVPMRGTPPPYPPGPPSAIPPHIAHQGGPHRGSTPTYPPGFPSQPPPVPAPSNFSNASPAQGPPGFSHTPPSRQPPANVIPDALAAIPEEQKALVMRVISMTPEEINSLAPPERASILQLRASLGVPT